MKKELLFLMLTAMPNLFIAQHAKPHASATQQNQDLVRKNGPNTFSGKWLTVNGDTEDLQHTKGTAAPAGCLNAPNGQYPTTTFTPTCDGSTAAITTSGFAGEYSALDVISGVTYTFTVSNTDYYITIADGSGTTELAAGTGTVIWTSTITGIIRFYSHINSSCGVGSSANIHTRSVKCGNLPAEPDYGCDQTYAGVPDTASNIIKNTTLNYAVANDFFVPMESVTYSLQSVTADVVVLASAGAADIGPFNIQIMNDSGTGTPGNSIKTIANVVPASITPLPNTFATYPTFAVKLNLGNYSLPTNSAADMRYWISLQATSASNTSIYWIGHQYIEGWNTKSNYISDDGGITWEQVTSTAAPGQHYDSNMMIDADCSVAAVNEAGNDTLSFYPNPVKDFLHINAGTKVETVHVYSVSGQRMPVPTKLKDGKVDMGKLSSGVYIISLILDDGKNASFKIIKK